MGSTLASRHQTLFKIKAFTAERVSHVPFTGPSRRHPQAISPSSAFNGHQLAPITRVCTRLATAVSRIPWHPLSNPRLQDARPLNLRAAKLTHLDKVCIQALSSQGLELIVNNSSDLIDAHSSHTTLEILAAASRKRRRLTSVFAKSLACNAYTHDSYHHLRLFGLPSRQSTLHRTALPLKAVYTSIRNIAVHSRIVFPSNVRLTKHAFT